MGIRALIVCMATANNRKENNMSHQSDNGNINRISNYRSSEGLGGEYGWDNHTSAPNVSNRERCAQCYGAKIIYPMGRGSNGRFLRDADGKLIQFACPTCIED